MRNFLILLVIITFQHNLSLSKEFEWTKITANKKGDKEYFLDFISLREVDNYNYQWILINYLDGTKNYKSEAAYATVDCKKKKIQEIILTQYSRICNGRYQVT